MPLIWTGIGLTAFSAAVGLVLLGHDDLAALSLLAGITALGMVLASLMRRRKSPRRHRGWRRGAAAPVAVLDGSNIMHWQDGRPDLGPVREVIAALEARGFRPGVVFDANAGYTLEGRYRHHQVLARQLGLPPDRVMVVNKGEVADALILQVAQDLKARVVSNDRFRDWRAQFPELGAPGFLISGRYRDGAVQLDL